ncbi:MAG: di-trans,poly-cis-decaprenylcistransferase [Zoogloeaceae bacterium]|nr:di-trans,poly-cis-decaprenylcistransferase [Zoogloeaceae bacterium]
MPLFQSATRELPEIRAVPRHVAIIMDGNGRWAKKRFLPRVAGHKKGVETVREAVAASIEQGVEYLTLFAFSSENWRRPPDEVSLLMRLFVHALENEVAKLKKNGVRLRVIGDLSRFDPKLQELVRLAEAATAENSRLHLTIAANYGGRWDILNAMNRLAREKPEAAGQWTEAELEACLSTAFAPEPDLFIRTGGEERISNFLLWQLAYTEFYFTETLWPEFDGKALKAAILSYQRRERRFGRTSEQLTGEEETC